MHRNKVNNKVYIGQTCQELNDRWKNGNGYKKCRYFGPAIQKYGWDNFEHIVLQTNLTAEEADYFEKKYIQEYEAMNREKGYNLREGGQKGYTLTPEHIQNMLDSRKNNGTWFNMGRAKKVKCVETGDIFNSIQEAERWCNSTKVSECCQGQRQHAGTHPQTKEKVSWQFANEDEEATIICHTPTREKKSAFTAVVCLNTNQYFNTMADAANWYSGKKGNSTCIRRCCTGERQSAGKHPITGEKLKWRFASLEEIQNYKGEK
jgi:group I intron endonuclease